MRLSLIWQRVTWGRAGQGRAGFLTDSLGQLTPILLSGLRLDWDWDWEVGIDSDVDFNVDHDEEII